MNKENLVNYLKEHPKAYIELDNDTYIIYPDIESYENDECEHYVSSDDIDSNCNEGIYKVQLMQAMAEIANLNIKIDLI